jgi:hypothetical protein
MDLQSTGTDFDLPYRLFSTGANPLWFEEEEIPPYRLRCTMGNVNVEEADKTNET